MAYEYPTAPGITRLFRTGDYWVLQFNGRRHEQRPSPDHAAAATSRHDKGLLNLDREQPAVPDDLSRRRAAGESL
jgi:hypothetical protein